MKTRNPAHSSIKRNCAFLGLLLSGLGIPMQIQASAQNEAGAQYTPDCILIQPNSRASIPALTKLHGSLKCRALRTFDRFGQTQVIALPKGATVNEYIAKYKNSGFVKFAEPDYIRHLDSVSPNDPKYLDGTLWALNNYGQNGGTPHADIDAPDAWGVLTSASNIVVAILDTGVRYTHEDLSANIWTNPKDGSHGTNAVAGTADPNDDNGHGTLMAGVIGAVGNNGIGIVGVAWQVRMMACKCFSSSGAASDSTILGCMDYAVANGAQIINASFDSTGFGQAFSNAIFIASTAGIIFVASAGNSSANIDVTPRYPACYNIDNIISVAYTTRNDALGGFSDYGATNVDLAAPGDQIYSTYYASDSSYYPPSGSGLNLAGTSFSAAYVSGACALMLTKYPADPYQLIISRILNATDHVSALAGKCATGGRLNLYKALSPPITLLPLQFTGGQFAFQVAAGPDRTCVIQASSDWVNWSPIYTNTTALTGTFDFTDAQSANFPQQFYRALSSP